MRYTETVSTKPKNPASEQPSAEKPRKRIFQTLDPDLHKRLKMWAADEETTLQGLIERLLRESAAAAGRCIVA
jgi:hypothetical protein